MVVSLGRGHCGAHLSLFFTIYDDESNWEMQGSTGAGLCLEEGVEAIAKGTEGGQSLEVIFSDGERSDEIYKLVQEELSRFIPEIMTYDWTLTIRMELPTSQGFGMSASGAIAAANALQRAMGFPHEECLRRSLLVAHIVERKLSNGLGDTTALASGGVERRTVAGSPYSGELLANGPGKSEGWSLRTPLLLCWKDSTGTQTSNYIDDPDWRVKINDSGIEAMAEVGTGDWDESRWLELFEKSNEFAEKSELLMDSTRQQLFEDVNRVVDACGMKDLAFPMLCMLGRSVVIAPIDAKSKGEFLSELEDSLTECGFNTKIGKVGPVA